MSDDYFLVRAGLIQAAVCTNITSIDEITERLNTESPTGISSRWTLSEQEELEDGTKLPAPCLDMPANKHYLFQCAMKQTPIRKVSPKMAAQKRQEAKLTQRLLELCGNCCEICGQHGGLVKHEIVFRGRQGDATDPLNVLMICPIKCHDHRKYPMTGTPLSTDEQLEIARNR